MLLFSDGFESFHPNSLGLKWTEASVSGGMVVFGDDSNYDPPMAFARKDGRALKFSSATLYKKLPKSRTVFVGLAFRLRDEGKGVDSKKIVVKFYSLDKELVATATHYLRQDSVDVTWDFTDSGVDSQYSQIFCPLSPYSGDYHYLEVGMTVYGNSENGASAWVESRMGTRTGRVENVFTAEPNSSKSHFLNGVSVGASYENSYNTDGRIIFDDVYVCNDEGQQNNDFLGDVRIRARAATADGTVNESSPVNSGVGGIYTAVNTAYVRADGESVPTPEPDPDEDPLYIHWDDPFSSYLILKRQEDVQLFRFRHTNFAGSEPQIFGAVLTALAKTSEDYPLQNAVLTPVVRSFGASSLSLGNGGIETVSDEVSSFSCALENEEAVNYDTGQTPEFWNSVTVNNAEFGFQLDRYEETLKGMQDKSPNYLRHLIVRDELVEDSLNVVADPGRFFEFFAGEAVSLAGDTDFQLTFPVYEDLAFSVSHAFGAKGCRKWVNSVIDMRVLIPWYLLWVHDTVSFEERCQFLWLQTVNQEFGLEEFVTGFWVEELSDEWEASGSLKSVLTLKALDEIGVLDFSLSNHEFLDEALLVESSYVWSGHEFLGETMYPDDGARFGWGQDIEDALGVEETHFDGNWVEFGDHQYSLTSSILTQQWRHEWFMGVCIKSWQIEPIEQEGDDGNAVGDLSSQYWENMGYTSNPLED